MFVPNGRHYIDQDDINAVVNALQQDYITTGPEVNIFEREYAEYVGAKYAVAVSSGTAALHVSCLTLGIGPGDEVITTPITFLSSANCVMYCGAKVVFADIDKDTYNISPIEIEKKITEKTKAIIPVHFAGQPCDMDKIHDIAEKYGLFVIEDAAHAIGADYKGRKIGSLSDLTTFSFHPVKHMTTCEGGMITTNNKDFYEKLKLYRAYCMTKDNTLLDRKDEGPWYYEMHDLGYNYRLSDVMCALGRSQLKKVNMFIEKRKAIVSKYNEELKNVKEIILPKQMEGCNSSWHLYVIQVKDGRRREIYTRMREKDINVDVHYFPVHKQPYYQKNGYMEVCCQNAENLYDQILSLPIFYKMTDEQQDYVIGTLKQVLEE